MGVIVIERRNYRLSPLVLKRGMYPAAGFT